MTDTDEVDSYLGGLQYPCSAEQVIDVALGSRAPQTIMDRLRALPEAQFGGLQDVHDAFARATPQP